MARSHYEQEIYVHASVAAVTAALLPQNATPAPEYCYSRTIYLRLGPISLPVTYSVTLKVDTDGVISTEAAPAPGVRTRSRVRCTPDGAGTHVFAEREVEAPSFIIG